MKTKNVVSETSTAFVEDAAVKPAEEENFEYTNLNNTLVELRKNPQITGYILKSPTTATIDLTDPNNLLDYALLSSKVMDSAQELSELFGIGKAESILVEGKTTKVLCVIKGENTVSIFMEKTADHNEVLDKIETTQAVSKVAP